MERNVKFGLPKQESIFKEYTDANTAVALSLTGNDYAIGFVNKEDKDFVHLKPSYLPRSLPFTEKTSLECPKIEEEIPTKIKKSLISKISPIDWEFIKSVAKNHYRISEEKKEKEYSERGIPKIIF